MTELRAALQDALGPLYRVEREVRPVGDCRLFVALERPSGPELLVKVLPGQLSLAVDSGVFERGVLLLAPRPGHPGLVPPKGRGRGRRRTGPPSTARGGGGAGEAGGARGTVVARGARATTCSPWGCSPTRCWRGSRPPPRRSPSRKCARCRRGWASWWSAASRPTPRGGGPARRPGSATSAAWAGG